MIRQLKKSYGQHSDLTVSRGKQHECLGMILDYSKKRKVIVYMVKYTKKTHEIFPEELSGTLSTPAAEHLFKVCDNTNKINKCY